MTDNRKYTKTPTTAADISARFDGTSQPDGRYRIACTAHGGTDKNLVIWDGDGGSLGAKCFSGQCSYQDILTSLGIEYTYSRLQYRRANGDKVERHRGPGKQITGRGSNKGLLVRLWGIDQPNNIVVLVEGEKAASALLAYDLPGYTPACWSGGGSAVGVIDYAPLKGREVVLWPDNDTAGLEAMRTAGSAAVAVGADHVRIVDSKSLPDKADIADVSPDDVLRLLASTDEFKVAGSNGVERVVFIWSDGNKTRSPAVRVYCSAEEYTVLPGGVRDLHNQARLREAWSVLTGQLPPLQSKDVWETTVSALVAKAEDVFPGHPEHGDVGEVEEIREYMEEYLDKAGVWTAETETETDDKDDAQSILDQSVPHRFINGEVCFFLHNLESWIHTYRGNPIGLKALPSRLRDAGYIPVKRRLTKRRVQRRVWTLDTTVGR